MGECFLAGHPPVGGKIGYGTYAGDDQATRTISLGVTPKWVLVFNKDGMPFRYLYASSGGGSNWLYGGLAIAGSPASSLSIVDGGFAVVYNSDLLRSNYPGMVFNYIYGA